jgi:AraC-like DNA-binding protein
MNMLSHHALREIRPPQRIPFPQPRYVETEPVGTPFRVELDRADRILRKTRQVALGRQRNGRGQTPSTTVEQACARLVFHRSSVRLRTGPGRTEIATPLHVSFHDVGEPLAREALGEEGSDCDWIAIAPDFLRMLRTLRFDKAAAATRANPVPRPLCEITPEIFLARYRLFAAASRPFGALNSREIDAAVEQLLVRIVEHAAARERFQRDQPHRSRSRRAQLIDDAKTILACEYQTDLTAGELALRLHCSSAYLSRTFHATTGFKLVDYRHELRLRKGACLIEQANAEIGEIAVRVGFASHSHFSSAFHRRFGITPSEYLNPAQ